MAGKYEREFEEEEMGRLEKSRRGYWANKAEFILACFGSVWGATTWIRFPYLCYRYGGFPVFFIAYVVVLLHLGFPMMLLEMTLGQYSSQGVLNVWRLCPLFRGVGVSMLLYCCISLAYTIPFISWPVYYFYLSFTSAWMNCDNYWNTASCISANAPPRAYYEFLNDTTCLARSYEVQFDGYCYENGERVAVHDEYVYRTQTGEFTVATDEYFSHEFIMETSDPNFAISEIVWKRILCLAVCWIVIALCLCVGVRSLGKVVYFTSTVPFVLLIVFFIRALTLPGSHTGMEYLFRPDFSRMLDVSLWTSAASEVIFGMGIGYGGYLTLASYNRFQNYYVCDALIVLLAHVVVRILAAVTVMGFAGFLAFKMEVSVSDVMASGSQVMFSLVPEALLRIPGAPAWCFFFFLLVFLMQLGAALPVMETVSTALCDLWRPLLKLRFVLVGIVSSALFLIGILFCTTAGQHLFNSLDLHVPLFYILVAVCAMSVCAAGYSAVCWMRYDIGLMLGGRHICLMIITGLVVIPVVFHWFLIPITSLVFLGFSAYEYMNPPSIVWWAQYVSFSVLAVILLPMLLCPIILFIIACCRGCRCRPVFCPESKWGPHLSRYRVRATHLPHINVSPLTAEGVKLNRMAPIARYDI